ncbi:hypothetical protein CSOJ01_14682, partial [Colletotrichum sojae]
SGLDVGASQRQIGREAPVVDGRAEFTQVPIRPYASVIEDNVVKLDPAAKCRHVLVEEFCEDMGVGMVSKPPTPFRDSCSDSGQYDIRRWPDTRDGQLQKRFSKTKLVGMAFAIPGESTRSLYLTAAGQWNHVYVFSTRRRRAEIKHTHQNRGRRELNLRGNYPEYVLAAGPVQFFAAAAVRFVQDIPQAMAPAFIICDVDEWAIFKSSLLSGKRLHVAPKPISPAHIAGYFLVFLSQDQNATQQSTWLDVLHARQLPFSRLSSKGILATKPVQRMRLVREMRASMGGRQEDVDCSNIMMTGDETVTSWQWHAAACNFSAHRTRRHSFSSVDGGWLLRPRSHREAAGRAPPWSMV